MKNQEIFDIHTVNCKLFDLIPVKMPNNKNISFTTKNGKTFTKKK